MKFSKTAVATTAIYLLPVASALASSGLQSENDLLPWANFVLVWLSIILISIAGVVVALTFGFANRIGDAGQRVGMWLVGASFLGGLSAGGLGWVLSHFGLTQGAIF